MKWLALLFLLITPPALAAEITVKSVISHNQVELSDGTRTKIPYIETPAPFRSQAIEYLKAHAIEKPLASLPAQLIGEGLARVYILPEYSNIESLFPLEQQARTNNKGLWTDASFAIRTPEQAHELLNSYGIVEGKVTSATKVKSHIYINFGSDWKTDFTIDLSSQAAKMLKKQGFDWQTGAGRAIRVRGWVEARYGPMIIVTQAPQIEIIE